MIAVLRREWRRTLVRATRESSQNAAKVVARARQHDGSGPPRFRDFDQRARAPAPRRSVAWPRRPVVVVLAGNG